MPKKTQISQSIEDYYDTLEHPMKDLLFALRKIILGADSSVGEQVKWNSPSFFFTGEMEEFDAKKYLRDIVVLNLHKPNLILMVFPTGNRIEDHEGVLEGKYEDGRRMISIRSAEDLESKSHAIQSVIKNWLSQVI